MTFIEWTVTIVFFIALAALIEAAWQFVERRKR